MRNRRAGSFLLALAAVGVLCLGLESASAPAAAQESDTAVCPTPTTAFADVPASHYANVDIGCLTALGIINGTSPTTFSPDKKITRAQTAALLARMWRKQGRACPAGANAFADVPASHYANVDIGCLTALGIINGTSPTTFSPDKKITRAQTAALLARMWRRTAPGETVADDDGAGGGAPGGGGPPGGGPGGPPGGGPGTPPSTSAPGRPLRPGLTVEDQSLGVSWTAPANNGAAITGYDVAYRVEDADLNTTGKQPSRWVSHAHTGAGTTATIGSLANGTGYQVRVRAENSVGEGQWSPVADAVPAGIPAVPDAPTVATRHQGLAVSWAASTDNGADITGYDVRHRACTATPKTCASSPTWGDWASHTHAGTATSTTIGSLTNGTAYQVQVQAANSVGDSGWSEPAVGTPAAQPPNAPSTSERTVAQGHEVSWVAPASNGRSITGYEVRYRVENSDDTWPSTWTFYAATDATTTSITIVLPNSGSEAARQTLAAANTPEVQAQVRALNEKGKGGWSAQPPDAPDALQATSIGAGLIATWTAPASNGAAITGYSVRYRVKDTDQGQTGDQPGSWTTLTGDADPGTNTDATITGLTNGTAYQVQVRATNSAGHGDWSPSVTGTPAAKKPAAPSAPIVTAKSQGLDVSWTAPADNGADITDYDVQHRACTATDGDTAVKTCAANPTWETNWTDRTGETGADTATQATISGLTNGTANQVRVRAANSVGESDWSPASRGTPTTGGTPDPQPPDAPDAPTVDAWNQSLRVSWKAPAINGSAVTGYSVRFRITDTDQDQSGDQPGTWTYRAHTDTSTRTVIESLTNGVGYQVQVLARSVAGDSAWSSSTAAVPAAQKPGQPVAPTVIVWNRSLWASWTAPAPNGAAVTDFDLQWRACTATDKTCATSPAWGSWTDRGGETTPNAATSATITGLGNGTAYQVQVRAANSAGESVWSIATTAIPAAQKPDAPTKPMVTPRHQSLRVSWTAPTDNGADITDYDVQYRACTATPKTCATNPTWGSWTHRSGETASDTSTIGTITGLTNGTAYQVRLRAANSVGESTWSKPSVKQSPAVQKPDAPAAPTLSVWNKSLDLSWTAPDDNGADITDYDVRYRACTATPKTCTTSPTWGDWTSHTHTGTGTTASIGSLTNGTAYQVQIRAANNIGDGAWSASATATPTAQKPEAPAAPTLTHGDQSLAVSWAEPTDNGADITDYDVQYRACTATPKTCNSSPTWGDWTSHTHTGTGTTASIGSLTNGTAYQVQIRAANSVGNSAWSASATEHPSTVPGAPTAPTLTVQDQSLGVSWTAPTGDGESPVTGYKVGRCATGCGTDSNWTVATLNSTGTTTTLSSLTNGTAYQVRVAAVNRSGDSAWSASATATPAREPDAPAAPTLSVWNKSLNVSWTAPDDNGADITDYDVRYRACTNSNDLTCATNPAWGDWASHTHTGTGTTASITGLTNGTAYQVQVRAANNIGDGAWSASATATPTAQKPEAPAAPTLTHGDQSLAVSWAEPTDNGADITDYDVQYRACTATPKTCNSSPTWGDWASHTHTGTGTTASIGSLTNGTAYQVQIRATNSVGNSAWSASATEHPSTVADAPAAPTLTVKDQSLGVSWTAPTGNGGSAVTGYKVGRCATGCGTDSNWTVATLNSTGTTTTLSSLTNGTAYQVRVAAVNRSGDSSWSTSATATPAREPDAPAAPTLSVWNKSLNVSWTAPDDNGADITDYDIQYRACTATPKTCTTSPTWGDWASHTHTGTGTTASITGLTNGTAYQVQVRAANSVGNSAWSTATTATPAAQKPEAPAAPTLTHGDQSLNVSWTAPEDNGADITDHDVQYRACTATPKTCTTSPTWGDWASHTHTGTGTTASIGSLTNGTAYQVQIRAANSVGNSAWSASATEHPSTVPGAPTAPTLTVQDQSLGVSWTAPTGNGGSPVTGYKVGRCSTGCGTDSNWTVATLNSTGTTTTLSSLTNGTAYQVRVAATNRSGDSTWSASATATPAREPNAPAAPTLSVWNKSLNLSWTAPEDNGADITDYDIQYRACTATPKTCTTSPTWGDWTSHTHTGTGTTATITGLTNGTAHQVQIRAANSLGNSAWSASATATPTAQKPEAPAAPTLTHGDQSLAVSWAEPTDNGADITDYDVRYRACTATPKTCTSSPTWGDWASHTHTGTGTTASIGSLTNGTAYQVQVRATNSAGDSAWSASATEHPSTVPDAPAAPTLTVQDQSLGVSWTAPTGNGGSPVTGYKVGRCSTGCGTDSNWTVATLNSTGTTTTLSSLTNDTAYQVRVAATNRSGDSAWSASATATPAGVPDPPAAPTLTKGAEQLGVSWTAPDDNGGDITDYDVQYRIKDTDQDTSGNQPGSWVSHNHTGTGTTTAITGLTNGTAYQVQIRATNSAGDSAWSVSAEAAPEDEPAQPAAPTLAHGDRRLGVSWTAPADNGQAISGYGVQYRACTATPKTCTSSPTWGDWASHTHTGTGTTASITGLTNGTAYQVQIRATNSVGNSAWSASATEHPSTVADAPAAPTLTVKDQSLGVSWTAPTGNGGSAVTGYKVGRCSTGCGTDANWTVATLNSTGTTTTLSSLTNGTAYQVRVAATNRSGDSTWSASTTATPAREPDTPAAPTLSVWNKSLRLSWTAPEDNGADVTDYDVQYRACTATPKTCTTSPTWGDWASHTHTGTGTTATITGLTNGTAYQVQIRAANSVGNSAWSASATATPTAQKPEAPAAPALTVGNQSLAVSWTAPGDNGADISDYDVRYRACTATPLSCATNPAWGDWASHTHTGTGTSASIGSLTNGTAYQVQVRAVNSVGNSAWSASTGEYPSTTPDAPTAVTLTVRDQSLGVSWTAPTGNGGSAVTGYKVGRCSTGCDTSSNWTVATLNSTGTTTTLNSLTNGTAYQVRVAATNRSGDSTWSASTTATPAREPDTPAAPTLSVWNKSLNLSWTAPEDNGADITDYDVQHRACTKSSDLTCATSPTWGDWTSHTHTGTGTTASITGLTNGTAYQVQVRAVNSVGNSAWSTAAKATPAAQKPAAPAAPTLAHGDQSLAVSWAEPADNGADITDYDVQHRACTKSSDLTCATNPTWGDWSSHTHTGTGATTTISSLTNGTAYQVQVRATNSVGDSAWSASATEHPSTTPDAPTAVTLAVKDQSLGVSWTAPTGDGGSAVTGYKVGRCSTGCGTDANWTVATLNSTGTTTTLSGLTNGTAYQVRGAATNRSGDSTWSASATATPAREPDTPAAPTLSVWNKTLNLSWTAPEDNGADITDYDVRYRACTATPKTCASSPTWGDWASHTHTGTGTSASITGLTNGTAYQVQVRAVNSVGNSAWSTAAKATPTAQKPEAPAAPTLTHGHQSLAASWAEPTDNGADISDYDVRHRACTKSSDLTCATNPTWGDWASHTHTGTGTTASITGLTNGTAYQVQVRAVNSVGNSAWSTSTGEYPSTTPDAPAAPTLTVKDQSLGVSWTAPTGDGGSAVTGYKVGRCSANCGTDSNWTVAALTGTTTTLSSLTNGTAYQVRVAATNRSGDSTWSTSATATPAREPDTPAAPAVTAWNKSLRLSWTAPEDNGADITDYDIQYRACTATPLSCTSSPTWGDWASHTHTGTGTAASITGLTNGTAYQVQVRATNSVGNSAWSTAAKAAPAIQKPDAPAAPALAVGNQILGVSWTAPTDNGADITDYDIQYRACTNSSDLTCATNPTWGDWAGHTHTGTGTSASITGLTNGTAYQVQVRATNSVGDSAWSTAATAAPAPQPPDQPAAPSASARHQALSVSWTAPAVNGSDITGYNLQYRACTATPLTCATNPTWGDWASHTHTGTGRTATIGSLTNGTAYQVQVQAKSAAGNSAWSASAKQTPAIQAPDQPAAPTLTAEHQSLAVSWTAPADNGADITGYDVRYRACTATPLTCATNPTWGDWASHTHTGTGTSASITGLTNGTAYQVQVRATNSVGDSAWSTAATAAPAPQPPDQPAAPTLTAEHQSLAVSWTAPAVNGSDITGYNLQYRACTATPLTCATNPTWGDWTGHTHTGTGRTATIGSLTNGTAYQVQVQAKSAAGNSAWSASAEQTPAPQPPDQPAAPTLTATSRSLGVSWSAPSTNGSDITGYNLQYRACTATPLSCATSPTWGDWTGHTHTGTGRTATIGSLTNGTAYQVQVQAESAAGNSAWSSSAKATPSTKPRRPTVTLSGVPGSPTVSRVSWTVADDGGATITGYDIDWRCHPGNAWASGRAGVSQWSVAGNVTSRDSSISECSSKLAPNQAYRFRVRARNANGASAYSPVVKTTPPSVSASAVSAVLAGTQMTVSWTASDGGLEISDHDVRYRRKDTDSTTPGDQPGSWTTLSGDDDPGTSTSATITGLTADAVYQVQVRATNAMGAGSWSGSLDWPQPPSAPGPVTVTADNMALDVSWTEPAVNGAAITDYDVRYRACTNSSDLTCATSPTWGSWTDRTGETNSDTATSLSLTGLTNGTAYEVQVRAANSIGESAWSATAKATPAPQPPDAPAAPTLTVSQTSLGVSWTEPAANGAAITDYDVRYRACTATPLNCTSSPVWGSWTEWNASDTSTTTSATITGLTQGTAYQVQVRAANSIGGGDWSGSTAAIPATVPGTPVAPTLTVKNQALAASWTAPADGGSAITDYDVQYRACTNSGDLTCASNPTWGSWNNRTGETNSDTAAEARITGLTNGTAYQARVRAANPAGDGAWSAASAKAVPTPSKPDPPSAPTLTVKYQGLAVSWPAPDNGGLAITDYDVQYRACTEGATICGTWGDWTDRTGETAGDTETTVTISGLTNGTAYQVRVRAANSLGDSAWSAVSKASPAPTAPDAPAAPAASYRDTALYVTYTEPATNGAAITDYDVRYRACTNSSDLTCATSPTWGDWTDRTGETAGDTSTAVTVSGLTNGTAYQVQVRAANSLGESGWSASGQGTPTPKPATPTGLTVTTGYESWTASWTAPSGPVVQYRAHYMRERTTPFKHWPTWGYSSYLKGRNSTSVSLESVQGVRNGQRWRVQVQAENLSGWSPLSGWVEFTVIAPPPVPTGVSLTVKDESLDVSWTSPSNSSGSPISDYDVQYRACTATPLTCTSSPTWGDWTEWNADDDSTTTSATITGLTNGTAYQVQVRSTNAAHDSAWSSAATATPADEPDAPGAPTVTAKHQGLAVSWTPPADNGRAITDYDVQYRACTATPLTCTSSPTWGNWTEWNASNTSTATSVTITGLTNETAYQVQVRATNGIGNSGWSSSSSKATPTPQPPDAPGAPTVTVWNKELRLSWTQPGVNGSAITDYDVRYRACTATPLTCTSSPTWGAWTEWNADNTSTTTSATITGLTNDTAYQLQVRAGSGVGDGAWSAATKATPTAQPPDAPGAPTLSYGNASLSASWTEPTSNGAAITDYDVQYRACTATPLTCTTNPTWGAWTEWNADNNSTTTSATVTGLTNGTAYEVQVRAGNSAGDGAWSASSASQYPSTVPAAPAAPTLTFGSQRLDVSWSAPADGGAAITDYDVQYRACTATPLTCTTNPTWGAWTEWNASNNSTTTSATITGLTNGTAYQVQARATNRAGDSAWSASATETPAQKPGRPAKPTVTRGDQKVAVSWTAPSDGGAAITDYNVNYKAQNGSAVNHPFTGTGTTTTISGLTNGTAYQVTVQAVNKAGGSNWSPWSDLVTPATVPSAPAAPTLTHGAASLGVSWTAPTENGDAITDYDVRYRACTNSGDLTCTSSPTWGSWSSRTHTGTGTTAAIGSLTNGTAYQVQVRASNTVGAGSWSASAKEHPSTVPGAPAAPTLSVWHASLTASWTAPTGDGGSAVTGYGVRYRACTATPLTCATNPTWGSWFSHTHTGTGTTAAIGSLTNDTAYQVQIAAKNRSGNGAWSPSASATPTAQKPSAPAAPALTVKHRALGVSWTAPDANGSDITDYDVQYRACTATPKTCATSPTWGDWTDRTGETAGDTSRTAELAGLTNGTAYQVRVRAANSLGESDWSPVSAATPATTPGAPGRPTVTAGAEQLSVSWTAPSSDGGAAITGYKVQHCDQSTGCDADDEWTTETHTGAGTTATIYNLTNGTTYRVRVAATNSVGDSAWSSYRTGKPKDKPSQPSAPKLVSGNASLSVTWTAPADNGSSITGYKVRYCGGDTANCSDDESTDWKEKSASGTSTTISSLVNGTVYRVKVRARNAVGDSDWSSETEGTPGAPAAPSRPTLTEGDGQLTVGWTQPANRGDAITAYNVEYCDSSNDCTDDSNWTDDSPSEVATSHTVTGLTNGTTYKVRVRAQNSRGSGGWSSTATATPATVPGAPDAPTLTAKNRALDVSWTAPSQTGGSAVTGYSVRYCDNSTGCDAANEWTVRTVSSGSTTTYTITGLTNGKTYEVGVAAKNRKGLGDYSSSTTATPAALPGKPGSLKVESAHQSLKVTWTASADNGSTITGYKVEYRKQNSDNTWPSTWTEHSHSDTSTYTTIYSLTNGSKYQVRVQATSNNGNSGWASAVTGTPKAVPDAPEAPTLTAGDRKIDLSWSEPGNDNGSAVTDYDVRYRKQNTNSTWPSSWTTLSHTGTATTAAMTSLTNGSAYQVQVRAENANGESPWSNASTATPAGKPLKPSTPTLTAGDQQLTVTWTAPSDNGSAITGYSVQYCDSTNDCTDDNNWADDNPSEVTTSHTITGLTNGTAYKVRVRAANELGDGPWSTAATGTPAGAPSAPENLAFVSGNAFLTVSWTTASNGSTISGHQVRYCNTSDSNKDCYSDYDDWTTVSVSGTATSKKVSSLTNGDYYDVEVRANSNQGYSDWSSSSQGVPGAPSKTTISTVTAGDDQFTVTWTAPNSNGDAITYYAVWYCNETNGDCAAGTSYEEFQSDPSTLSLNITSLDDASKYRVRVRAANNRGAGEWSTVKTVTTT